MRMFLSYVIGVIQPIGPRRWTAAIRGIRTSEGWFPPMMLLATMGVLCFGGQGIGLLAGNAPLTAFNYFALATWFVIGGIATCAVAVDGFNNLRRFDVRGIVRPRWWFEISRLSWISLVFAVLSATLIYFAGGRLLRPVGDWLFGVMPTLFVIFWLTGSGGYAASVITQRPRRGRAFECVQYFYWLFGVIGPLTTAAIWIPVGARWAQPMILIGCLVAASLIAALVLTIANRHE